MKNLSEIKTAKFIYFVFGLFAISAIIFFAFTHSKISAKSQAAKIVFAEESHDFGKVEQGINLEYSFKFTNEGNEPLVIERVQPSCGCTGAATDSKTEYAEGESGEIKITFNTQGREGHIEKHIQVFSNDKDNIQKNLKFSCDIELRNK
jgi:hypothetical protein